MTTFDRVSRKILTLLESERLDYLIIGGLAASIVGEARMTQDLDILIFISKENMGQFLMLAQKKGFKFDKNKLKEDLDLRGTFRLTYDGFHVDFICGAMPFEVEALRRKQGIPLYGMRVSFPSPEDLILFKLMPGREKDLLDVQGIFIRHRKKLNLAYLRKWAGIISHDLQDPKICKRLKGLIKK